MTIRKYIAGLSKERILLFLGQIALLVIAVPIGLALAEGLLLAAFLVFDSNSDAARRLLAAGVFLVLCVSIFLCVRGARMTSRAVRLTSRIVLALLSVGAAIVAIEPIWVGVMTAATGTRDAYLFLPAGLALAALSAAGIRYAFGWRVRFWIMFLVVLAAIVFGTFGFVIFS